MRRLSRQYLYITFGIGGVMMFIIIMQVFLSPTPASKENILIREPQLNYDDLNRKIGAIELEIQSQVYDSKLLLNKIKTSLKSNSTVLKVETEKLKPEKEKLKELHHELAQEAHQGEVDSGIGIGGVGAGEGPLQSLDDDENGAHEIIEEHSKESVIAILIFVCNRPTVTRCLDKLLNHRPSKQQFPIILSQDCGKHDKTIQALKPYEKEFLHIYQPDQGPVDVPSEHYRFEGYYKISRHYGFALNYVFNKLNYSNVIIVEDDLEVASDFFEYFSATLSILEKDPSLWCVSAWNDNGKPSRIDLSKPELLYRTDFFPGLGWMLTKKLWNEIGPKWPRAFWDDWMREPAQRKDRACIRPEISRTSTFGKIGVSLGTYYQNHLKFIKLNEQFVKFSTLDLSFLTKEKYDQSYLDQVRSATLIYSTKDLNTAISNSKNPKEEFRFIYNNYLHFKGLANKLQIMDDSKASVPRTAYLGIVTTMVDNHRIYLDPGPNWSGYTKS